MNTGLRNHAILKPYLHVRRPEREVVTQQLHDERGVLVRLLAQGVKLGDGLVESLQNNKHQPRGGLGLGWAAETAGGGLRVRREALRRAKIGGIADASIRTCFARWQARSGELTIS